MCALPSAQLGGMPSLNVPSYIPTTVIQKEPKAWEKALLAILTQAGAAVAQQGVSNAMSQDYALEFDKTPTSGPQKFLKGPTTNERQALAARADTGATNRLQAEMDSARDLQANRLDAEAMHDASAYADRGLDNVDRDIAARGLEKLRMENDTKNLGIRSADEQALARLKAQLEREDPYRSAMAADVSSQERLRSADAMRVEKTNKLIPDKVQTGGKGVTLPGLPKPGEAPPPLPVASVSTDDRIRQGLAAGKTIEEIVQGIQDEARQLATRKAAQTAVKDKDTSAVDAIKAHLFNMSPWTDPTMGGFGL